VNDPFSPPSAKPATEAERIKRRITEGASQGGKAHRGCPKPMRLQFGRKTKKAKK